MTKTAFSWLLLFTLILLFSCNPKKRALRKMMAGCDTVAMAAQKSPRYSGKAAIYHSEQFVNQAAEAFIDGTYQLTRRISAVGGIRAIYDRFKMTNEIRGCKVPLIH